jgi:hypothetical protein
MPDLRHRTGVFCTVGLEIEVHCHSNKHPRDVDRNRDNGILSIHDSSAWLGLHVCWKRKRFRFYQMYTLNSLPLAAAINTCLNGRDPDNIL